MTSSISKTAAFEAYPILSRLSSMEDGELNKLELDIKDGKLVLVKSGASHGWTTSQKLEKIHHIFGKIEALCSDRSLMNDSGTDLESERIKSKLGYFKNKLLGRVDQLENSTNICDIFSRHPVSKSSLFALRNKILNMKITFEGPSKYTAIKMDHQHYNIFDPNPAKSAATSLAAPEEAPSILDLELPTFDLRARKEIT